ncbi:hypothetical protein [Paracoccus salsus]|uniref:hypothetical protein n=1 Tax=Paracoccus salsus TaxID=2911061 RepID=UPI001F42E340|nr:hypothetical protein [Paracoccus salsus]MCF3972310.1 hypothetical protein [Paracoccus salsus]
MKAIRVLAILAAVTMPLAAQAQMDEDEMQRCVWRCLADSPGAASQQYDACVQRMCVNPAPPRAQPSGWGNTGDASGGGQMASITVGLSTLAYSCQPGKPAVLGIDGLPGPSDGIIVTVDGREFRPRFARQNTVHYTVLPPGSDLLAALLAGRSAQLRNPAGKSVSGFPLAGSARAIGVAMARCGISR